MANTKISGMTADASITGVEELLAADAGVNKRMLVSDLAVYVKGTSPSVLRLRGWKRRITCVKSSGACQIAGSNVLYSVLAFDQTTAESAYWAFAIPTGLVIASATLEIYSTQPAATTGTVGWIVKTISRADAEAIDTAPASDTVTADTVEGTAGLLHRQSKALTVTGWAAGEVLFVTIERDVATDTELKTRTL